MKGWKTWAGAAIIGAGAILNFLGLPEFGKIVMGLGAALGVVGIGHKIEKKG